MAWGGGGRWRQVVGTASGLAGTAAKGHYVACGLLIGTDVKADEAPATESEATLLVNAIRWGAAGGR